MRLICGHCGHVNPAGVAFCEKCDEYLDWTAAEAPDAARTQPLPDPATPGATTGTAQVPAQVPAQTAVRSEVVRSCPRCATGNPLERRFCRRCGAWLVPASGPPVAPPEPWWRSAWRRLVGPMNRAERVAYRHSLSPVTRAFRWGLLSLFVVVLVVVLSPFTGNPVGRARDLVQHQLGAGKVDKGQYLVTFRADKASRGDAALASLKDDVRDTAWSVPWHQPADGGGPLPATCTGTPQASFFVTFPAPIDVREIGFQSGGLGDLGKPDQITSWLPQTVDLEWTAVNGDGSQSTSCDRFDLDQTTGLQRVGVSAGLVKSVRVMVQSAFPPPSARTPSPSLRIGEVTFWQR